MLKEKEQIPLTFIICSAITLFWRNKILKINNVHTGTIIYSTFQVWYFMVHTRYSEMVHGIVRYFDLARPACLLQFFPVSSHLCLYVPSTFLLLTVRYIKNYDNIKYPILIPKAKWPKAVETTQNGSITQDDTKAIYVTKKYSKHQHFAWDFYWVKTGYSPFCFASSFFLFLHFTILFFLLFIPFSNYFVNYD